MCIRDRYTSAHDLDIFKKVVDINLVGTVIAVRPYCHTDHYWQVYFDTNEAIVRVCKEAGWPAPTPTQIMKTMPA